MKQILVAVALLTICLVPGVSRAATIFSDNFNGENAGVTALNYTGFANWTVVPGSGTVDLIGVGGIFDLIPGNGLYVDLDGTSLNAGVMRSDALGLLTGTEYTLTFDLAGSQRGDSNTLTYGIDLNNDGLLNDGITVTPADITLGSAALFSTYSLTFTTPVLGSFVDARIRFGQAGGDNIGLLLDNVKMTTVPEPASLMLLGAGLAAIGIWRRKAAAK